MKVRIVGPNQTEVILSDRSLFFSYETLVGLRLSGVGYFRTSTKYSKTTSRHVNQWLDGVAAKEVEQDELEQLAEAPAVAHV